MRDEEYDGWLAANSTIDSASLPSSRHRRISANTFDMDSMNSTIATRSFDSRSHLEVTLNGTNSSTVASATKATASATTAAASATKDPRLYSFLYPQPTTQKPQAPPASKLPPPPLSFRPETKGNDDYGWSNLPSLTHVSSSSSSSSSSTDAFSFHFRQKGSAKSVPPPPPLTKEDLSPYWSEHDLSSDGTKGGGVVMPVALNWTADVNESSPSRMPREATGTAFEEWVRTKGVALRKAKQRSANGDAGKPAVLNATNASYGTRTVQFRPYSGEAEAGRTATRVTGGAGNVSSDEERGHSMKEIERARNSSVLVATFDDGSTNDTSTLNSTMNALVDEEENDTTTLNEVINTLEGEETNDTETLNAAIIQLADEHENDTATLNATMNALADEDENDAKDQPKTPQDTKAPPPSDWRSRNSNPSVESVSVEYGNKANFGRSIGTSGPRTRTPILRASSFGPEARQKVMLMETPPRHNITSVDQKSTRVRRRGASPAPAKPHLSTPAARAADAALRCIVLLDGCSPTAEIVSPRPIVTALPDVPPSQRYLKVEGSYPSSPNLRMQRGVPIDGIEKEYPTTETSDESGGENHYLQNSDKAVRDVSGEIIGYSEDIPAEFRPYYDEWGEDAMFFEKYNEIMENSQQQKQRKQQKQQKLQKQQMGCQDKNGYRDGNATKTSGKQEPTASRGRSGAEEKKRDGRKSIDRFIVRGRPTENREENKGTRDRRHRMQSDVRRSPSRKREEMRRERSRSRVGQRDRNYPDNDDNNDDDNPRGTRKEGKMFQSPDQESSDWMKVKGEWPSSAAIDETLEDRSAISAREEGKTEELEASKLRNFMMEERKRITAKMDQKQRSGSQVDGKSSTSGKIGIPPAKPGEISDVYTSSDDEARIKPSDCPFDERVEEESGGGIAVRPSIGGKRINSTSSGEDTETSFNDYVAIRKQRAIAVANKKDLLSVADPKQFSKAFHQKLQTLERWSSSKPVLPNSSRSPGGTTHGSKISTNGTDGTDAEGGNPTGIPLTNISTRPNNNSSEESVASFTQLASRSSRDGNDFMKNTTHQFNDDISVNIEDLGQSFGSHSLPLQTEMNSVNGLENVVKKTFGSPFPTEDELQQDMTEHPIPPPPESTKIKTRAKSIVSTLLKKGNDSPGRSKKARGRRNKEAAYIYRDPPSKQNRRDEAPHQPLKVQENSDRGRNRARSKSRVRGVSIIRSIRSLSRHRSSKMHVRSQSLDSILSAVPRVVRANDPQAQKSSNPSIRSLLSKFRPASKPKVGAATPRSALLNHWTSIPDESDSLSEKIPISIEYLVQMQRDALSVVSGSVVGGGRAEPYSANRLNLPGILSAAEVNGDEKRVLDRLGMSVVPRRRNQWDENWKSAASATFDDGESCAGGTQKSSYSGISGKFDVSHVLGVNLTPLRSNVLTQLGSVSGRNTVQTNKTQKRSVTSRIFGWNSTVPESTVVTAQEQSTKVTQISNKSCMDCCDDDELTEDSNSIVTMETEANEHMKSIRCMATMCHFKNLQNCTQKLSRWISSPSASKPDNDRNILNELTKGPNPYMEKNHVTRFTNRNSNGTLDFEETLNIFEQTLRYHKDRGDKLEYVYYKCSSSNKMKPISYVIV